MLLDDGVRVGVRDEDVHIDNRRAQKSKTRGNARVGLFVCGVFIAKRPHCSSHSDLLHVVVEGRGSSGSAGRGAGANSEESMADDDETTFLQAHILEPIRTRARKILARRSAYGAVFCLHFVRAFQKLEKPRRCLVLQ